MSKKKELSLCEEQENHSHAHLYNEIYEWLSTGRMDQYSRYIEDVVSAEKLSKKEFRIRIEILLTYIAVGVGLLILESKGYSQAPETILLPIIAIGYLLYTGNRRVAGLVHTIEESSTIVDSLRKKGFDTNIRDSIHIVSKIEDINRELTPFQSQKKKDSDDMDVIEMVVTPDNHLTRRQ